MRTRRAVVGLVAVITLAGCSATPVAAPVTSTVTATIIRTTAVTTTVTATPTSEAPATFTLTGTFQLTGSNSLPVDKGCAGKGGYTDIADGTAVTVYNETGAVIGSGTISESKFLGDSTIAGMSGPCTFQVSVLRHARIMT